MQIDLAGRTALVSGSTGGIGLAIASGLLDAGADVVINGRSATTVERAVATLKSRHPDGRIDGIAADLGTAPGAQALIDGLVDRAIDILVNNVAIFGLKDFFETDDATWETFLQTNVMSAVRLSRALLPAMVARQWGRVVFISSESARNIPADMVHYGVTKTALLALSRGLAKRLAGTGVTVNAVLPGPTLSDGFAAMMKDEIARTGKSLEELGREFVQAHRPSSVLGRAATVDEVANMVVYVCSTLASATSGAALRVDGGVIDDIV